MGKRLGAALDELRTAFFEAYAALAEEGAKTGNEQQRRESSLRSIDEILEWRPLAAFSATHLGLLEIHRLRQATGARRCAQEGMAARCSTKTVPTPLKKAASGFRVSHAFRPVLGNDAGDIQLGGSGDTADDRPTARARMGDRGLCERL
jgi:hypothetical protein